jgi:polar amino acid transport system permease protein
MLILEKIQNFFLLFRYLLPGLGVTISVTFTVLAVGFLLGIIMAVLRVYGGRIFSGLAAGYSIIARAVPVVVTIFILYFVIAEFISLTPFLSGSLALGLTSGAYQSEIFRGAILSVPQGQMIAARAIGMSKHKAIFSIILPQAIRLAIPAWSNEVTLVLKDSTMVYVIGVPEILRRAQWISARNLEPFMTFITAAAFYIIITFLISQVLDFLERRYKIVL